MLRPDIQVLQIQARPTQEGGEVLKKQGEAHLCPVLQGKEDLGSALFKQLVPEGGLIGHHLVQQVLVVGQLPDELQDQERVGLLCKSKGQCHVNPLISVLPGSPPPWGAPHRNPAFNWGGQAEPSHSKVPPRRTPDAAPRRQAPAHFSVTTVTPLSPSP